MRLFVDLFHCHEVSYTALSVSAMTMESGHIPADFPHRPGWSATAIAYDRTTVVYGAVPHVNPCEDHRSMDVRHTCIWNSSV